MSKRREFLINTTIATLGTGFVGKSVVKKESSDLVACDKTTADYFGEGPFYTDGPPLIANNLLANETEPGERLIISGRVFNLECSEFIPDTIVDIWHADNDGAYDNVGYKLRGFTRTNAQGFYLFETILPGKYLNGNDFRPAHIHLKIIPPGFPTLTTQVYFEGDDKIANDRAASITTGEFDATHRIISLSTNAEDKLEGQFDIVINGSGITVGVQNLHLNTGMIYKAQPNPFEESLEIHYGVFKAAKVGLVVYNIQGQQVAVLADKNMQAEKYYATWEPDTSVPSGYYFVAIKINDLQVHYLKVYKK